jgi:hydroxyacylglutathione hydrolase
MSLDFKTFNLGPLDNNSYLIFDSDIHEGIVIDPSFDIETLVNYAKNCEIKITQAWLTHAHYDHFAGLFTLRENFHGLKTALHLKDQFLWDMGGLSSFWNLNVNLDFSPEIPLENGFQLPLGDHIFTVIHTPGHSPGHVVFYNKSLNTIFCGDLIFYQGVGRTDLPGGNETDLRNSITNNIFTLSPSTMLLCGHGAPTTVQQEQTENPYF